MEKMDNNKDDDMNNHIEKLNVFIKSLGSLDEYRLPQRAYHIIRLAIRELVLPPGMTILEREMSEALQMSRTPVREALVRLETERLVRLIPRRGFIVEPIEEEDLKEIFLIIQNLDGLATEIATSMITDDEIIQLEAIVEEQEDALANKDLKKWTTSDENFHNLIIKFANNQRLSSVIETHSDQTYRARLLTIEHRPLPTRSIIEHKAVISCMKAKDERAARTIMQSHRDRAQAEIIRTLKKIKNDSL